MTALVDLTKLFKKDESIFLNEHTFASTHKSLLEVAATPYFLSLPKTYSLVIDFNKETINKLAENISDNNPSGICSTNYGYLDRIFVHEMVHAIMAANINYYWELWMQLID